jgi:hypothetical protein
MPNDDSRSISCALLSEDSQQPNNDTINQLISSSTTKPINKNNKWTLRNSISSASFRRYRPSLRRTGMNNRSNNSQCPPPISFPLFRRFYLMRSSFTHKPPPESSNNINEPDTLTSSEISYSSPRIKASHVLTTIFITLVSACLLIFMIILDLGYLNDAIPNSIDQQMITSNMNNKTTLCFRHPKVCVMKGLVILVFIVITVILCYTILTLYTHARRHSRLLERKTDELEKEKCLTEKLLHEILPPCVAKDLINGRKAPAEYYESVTVYFSDIVGFTIIAR